MFLGEAIKTARMAKNLTQAELGERVGVSQQTVWRWEETDATPRISKLDVLAGVLELDYAELLDMAVQMATIRAQRRVDVTNQQQQLRVVRNDPITHTRDRTPATGEGQGSAEDRIAALERQMVLVLQRVGALAEALGQAGVIPVSPRATSADGKGQPARRSTSRRKQ